MITYVPTPHCKDNPQEARCPFGERDLQNDECYSGNGRNRSPYFIRYDWSDEHSGYIACNHPPKPKYVQLSLFDT